MLSTRFQVSLVVSQGIRFLASIASDQRILCGKFAWDTITQAPMPLAHGEKLGQYQILSLIGAGGMGEVYRATDTQLKRDVALKVLPAVFSADPERLARFQREAEVLASLNHPNIAHLYGLAEADGVRALVMELVEGESPQGPMPFDDAWGIMTQVADGLEYAHERRIIHRDLKPANLKITPDGRVKILDFGLAKALSAPVRAAASASVDSPTLTMGATQAGVILGTAAYMAPEQIKGKEADRRADIWAFGIVLYELLTGSVLSRATTPPKSWHTPSWPNLSSTRLQPRFDG